MENLTDSTAREIEREPSSQPTLEVFETPSREPIAPWRHYVNSLIAKEVSALTRYVGKLVQWQPRENDTLTLLDQVDAPEKGTAAETGDLKNATEQELAVLINGNFNHDYDIEGTLRKFAAVLERSSRVIVIAYNPYLRFVYHLANRLGLRKGEEPDTFVTEVDIRNLARLAGFEVVRSRPVGYLPGRLLGVGTILNRLLSVVPIVRWFCLAQVVVLRPVRPASHKPSLTIVIPARNEKGNIENALKRMPSFDGADLEIIFVEGHSSDDTWSEIQRVVQEYQGRFNLSAYQQTGKGKSDAVRLGFSHASKELLTILDADLTMPPELLERFYEAYCRGDADFINGSRLVYPMEGNAMRFLNRLGNVFFAKALSYVLDVRIGDSLCGTKLLSRRDYARFGEWRKDFGDFDPFGDFELLFPASQLSLGIIDIPIRYRDRTYGSTNISRFRHGLMLLRMTTIGFLRMKLGRL